MPRKPKPPGYLEQFCYSRDCPPHLSGMTEPWAVDGWWYATDGRILVAHHKPRLKAQKPAGRVPSLETCQEILPDAKKGRWYKWPADPLTSPCVECTGKGSGCVTCGDTGNGLFKVNGVWLARRYWWAIKSLPKAYYLWRRTRPSDRPIRFRYDGGVGAVMPVVRGG